MKHYYESVDEVENAFPERPSQAACMKLRLFSMHQAEIIFKCGAKKNASKRKTGFASHQAEICWDMIYVIMISWDSQIVCSQMKRFCSPKVTKEDWKNSPETKTMRENFNQMVSAFWELHSFDHETYLKVKPSMEALPLPWQDMWLKLSHLLEKRKRLIRMQIHLKQAQAAQACSKTWLDAHNFPWSRRLTETPKRRCASFAIRATSSLPKKRRIACRISGPQRRWNGYFESLQRRDALFEKVLKDSRTPSRACFICQSATNCGKRRLRTWGVRQSRVATSHASLVCSGSFEAFLIANKEKQGCFKWAGTLGICSAVRHLNLTTAKSSLSARDALEIHFFLFYTWCEDKCFVNPTSRPKPELRPVEMEASRWVVLKGKACASPAIPKLNAEQTTFIQVQSCWWIPEWPLRNASSELFCRTPGWGGNCGCLFVTCFVPVEPVHAGLCRQNRLSAGPLKHLINLIYWAQVEGTNDKAHTDVWSASQMFLVTVLSVIPCRRAWTHWMTTWRRQTKGFRAWMIWITCFG